MPSGRNRSLILLRFLPPLGKLKVRVLATSALAFARYDSAHEIDEPYQTPESSTNIHFRFILCLQTSSDRFDWDER